MKLSDAREPILAALQRLAESPRELRCFVIIENPLTRRFVQFATPPPPSRYTGADRIACKEPIYYDGTGAVDPKEYRPSRQCCTPEQGASIAIGVLAVHLPGDAELRITEESTHVARPS